MSSFVCVKLVIAVCVLCACVCAYPLPDNGGGILNVDDRPPVKLSSGIYVSCQEMRSNTLHVDTCASHCTTPSEHNAQQLAAVKVGCLHVNLATAHGRRMFLLQMLVLCFVPHAALVVQNCTAMAQLSMTLDNALYLHTEVGNTLYLGEAITAVIEERILITGYCSTKEGKPGRNQLETTFKETDMRLRAIPDGVLQDWHRMAL